MSPVFLIAEAGVNHNGNLDLAMALCESASRAGADAVKFQTFRSVDLVVPGAPTAAYQRRQTGHEDQAEMLRKLELSEADHRMIQGYCKDLGIEFFSTPFSVGAIAMLTRLGVKRLKLSSGELTHRALVEAAAATGLPLILSTGMATEEEITEALDWVRAIRGSLNQVAVLHCTSSYPADDSQLNLLALQTMRSRWSIPVGYSDHSLGIEASLAAVALGATIIEKHLTLDRTLSGPDHAASLEPREFSMLVNGVRRIERMLGDGIKRPHPTEDEIAKVARRSVVMARPVPAGAVIGTDDLTCRRPGTGMEPKYLTSLLGRRAARAMNAGDMPNWEDFLPAGP